MARISNRCFYIIKEGIMNNARLLEQKLFEYHFEDANGEAVIEVLSQYQNNDGGFGHGLEPDFKLVSSSAMATSIGLGILSHFDNLELAQEMIRKAIRYLEETYDSNRRGWYAVPKEVNNFPHAPWWTYSDDIKMTVIDISWGNPTAELIGYLSRYRKYLESLNIQFLLEHTVNFLNQKKTFESEHELYCFIRMYNEMGLEYKKMMEKVITLGVRQLINLNETEWINYVPTPLKFIEEGAVDYFQISESDINRNLDYYIRILENNKRIEPNWQWGMYEAEWNVAKREWTGIITLEALIKLRMFNRI